MVDWDLVDKRRAKGWDWERVAADPKVGFTADPSAGEPGRALRSLYYQRRSRSQRTGDDSKAGGAGPEAPSPERTFGRIALAGYVLVPLVGAWFVIALAIPSPVGAYVPAIPYLAFLLAIAGIVLAYGLLRSQERWNRSFRNAAISGLVVGVVIAGAFGGIALLSGCPTLTSNTTSVAATAVGSGPSGSNPGLWEHASNSEWTSNGVPMLFFYGSIACPYCSASSWAMATALRAFPSSTLGGWAYGHSDNNPDDIPDTPEIILANAYESSPYVGLHVDESTNDAVISAPSTPSCTDSSYVSTYDSTGSIPFVVIGGQYIHVGTLVDPTALRTTPGDASSSPLNATQVQDEINAQNGTAWEYISPEVYVIEALICHLNGNQPTSIAQIPQVATILKGLG